ncbi:hypothetical protein SCHPADRAFT_684837 [Schizopora paradoxa]|uniref:N-acetyltransferase domain-containing protein n=1 Tax=Schizopora paradoxa TaxID=27342 RepID=A0A0H2RAQ7_9AGAM|nr:hypothetical protein SCHPADRAFT_684837 [Schizopora paradoxa]
MSTTKFRTDAHGKQSTWCNSYTTQPQDVELNCALPLDELYGSEPYDINFCFPYLPAALCDEKLGVKLVPFIPRLHAETFFRFAVQHPEDFQYTRFPIPRSLEEMLAWFERTCRRNTFNSAFAVLFRDDNGIWIFGGFLMLVACNPESLSADIATGILFHNFRGRSRAREPCSLILRYCLNTPSDEVAGLGLRRVGWHAEAHNYPSQSLALSLGFRLESMRRWSRTVPPGRRGNGKRLRKGDPVHSAGADEVYYTLCWDDWDAFGRNIAKGVFAKEFPVKAKL